MGDAFRMKKLIHRKMSDGIPKFRGRLQKRKRNYEKETVKTEANRVIRVLKRVVDGRGWGSLMEKSV